MAKTINSKNPYGKVTTSDKLTFDGSNVTLKYPAAFYYPYKLNSAVPINIISDKINQGGVLFLQGDGDALHVPTLTNAEQDGDESFVTTDNYVNPIILWNRWDKVIYRIMSGYIIGQLSAAVMTITSLSQTSLGIAIDSNPNGVDIYMSETSGGVYSLYQSLTSGVLTANNLTGLTAGTTRYFKNIKKGDGITTSDSNLSIEYSGTTGALTQMAAPIITVIAASTTALNISINTNINGVDLFMSETIGGTYTFYQSLTSGTLTANQLTGLAAATTRYFKGIAKGNGATTSDSNLSNEYSGTTTNISLKANGLNDYINTGFSFTGLIDTDTLEFEFSGNDLKPSVATSYLAGSLNNATPIQRLIFLYLSVSNTIANQVTSAYGTIVITGASLSATEISSIKIDANKTSPNKLTIFINGSQYAQGAIGNMSEFNGAPELFLYAYNKIGAQATIGGNSDISIHNFKILKNNIEVINLVANQAGYFDETISGTIKYNRGLTVNTYPLTVV